MSTQKVIWWIIKMSSFKFGQKEIASKDFHKQRQLINIQLNKFLVSDRLSCYNGKNWWYILGYQVDGETNPTYIMSFIASEVTEWVLHYWSIWNEVESWLFENLTTESIKGEGKYMHCKLKIWREWMKINLDGQDVPYDMYCKATPV